MKKKEKWFDSSIIKEDTSKATKNTKHFIFNNGTRKAIITPSSINYFDTSENVWKPIDNSLKATEDGYNANLGEYTAKLSKRSENEAIEVSNGTDKISWEYLGINKNVFPKLKHNTPIKRKSKLNTSTEKSDSFGLSCVGHAIFSNAEGNIDLDYRIEGNGIKENIIIKA